MIAELLRGRFPYRPRLARTLDLLGDPDLQERLRQGGFETVRRYTWERAIDLPEAAYRAIAGERFPSGRAV